MHTFLKFCGLLAGLLAGTAAAQSLKHSEMAAERCMYDVALEFLDKGPKTERDSRAGLLLRARLLVQLERGRDALTTLRLVPKSRVPAEEADRLLAFAFAHGSAGELDQAERAFADAAAAGADADIVDGGIAGLRIQAGKLTEAEQLLRVVLRRSPSLSGALYNLAVVRSKSGDVAEAAALLRQAWQFGLRDVELLKRDPDLKAVREAKGLIGDLLTASVPRCGTY